MRSIAYGRVREQRRRGWARAVVSRLHLEIWGWSLTRVYGRCARQDNTYTSVAVFLWDFIGGRFNIDARTRAASIPILRWCKTTRFGWQGRLFPWLSLLSGLPRRRGLLAFGLTLRANIHTHAHARSTTGEKKAGKGNKWRGSNESLSSNVELPSFHNALIPRWEPI